MSPSTPASVAEQVAAALETSSAVPPRPTADEVMCVVDLNTKIEAFLVAAVNAWMTSDHPNPHDQNRYRGAHHVAVEGWDEDGAQVSFYPRWVSARAYAEYTTIPLGDLLPDFVEKQNFLRALEARPPGAPL